MTQTVTLGGGCFWCLDAAYQMVKGVKKVVVGYAGGTTQNPSYVSVSSGTTGHAEVTHITFDDSVVTLDDILTVFWTIHDPTSLNFQGHDIGTQYRSCIFYETDEQKHVIEKSLEAVKSVWDKPVVTTVEPLEAFYPAEEEHQNYFAKNPDAGYCQVVINPKLAHLQLTSAALLR